MSGPDRAPRSSRCGAVGRGRGVALTAHREDLGDWARPLVGAVRRGRLRVAAVRWVSDRGHGEFTSLAGGSGARLFDLASLAKPFTATLALRLDALGLLGLETRVAAIGEPSRWPPTAAETTLEDLLRHRAGRVPWLPLYALDWRWDERLAPRLLGDHAGGARRGVYSDLGYLAWGRLAEERLGTPLRDLLDEHVLEPLGLLAEVLAADGSAARAGDRVLASPMGTSVEVRLAEGLGLSVDDLGPPRRGEAQDGNARWLSRYCGHAGLYGSVDAVFELGDRWLRAAGGRGGFLSPEAVRRALAGTGTRRLGWWMRTLRGAGGAALSTRAFGHTGFTGGSLWIDPEIGLVAVLLAHRSDPEVDMQPLRRAMHRRIVAAGADGRAGGGSG